MEKTYTFITGASSGMGEATAKLLSLTHNLILHGRDLERLNIVAQECAKNNNEILVFPYDLVNVQTLATDLKDFLKEKNAKVSSFVHYAGMIDLLPASKTKYSLGLQVMNVNYFAAVEIISTLLKRKINDNALESIVLISSTVVQTGKKYQPHYVASKGAIEGLGKALALELAPQIRVNVVAPGSFKTRMLETVFVDPCALQDWTPDVLLAPGSVDDIARLVRFLLSEDARYLTGERISLDGGERVAYMR